MLKIAFLVTFCGLLARMAQAQTTLPCSNYNAAVAADTFQDTVAKDVPLNYIAPVPKQSITDKATGAEYTNVKPAKPPTVGCKVTTTEGGYMDVSVTGDSDYIGDVTGKTPTKGVPSGVSNQVNVPYTVEKTPEGDIKCKAPPSMDQAQVTSTPKKATGGLFGGLVDALLKLLDSLLSSLTNVLGETLKSTLPDLVKTVEELLNGILKTVTDSKPVPGKGTCKHNVNDVKTGPGNYLNLQLQSNKYGLDGKPKDPPSGEYVSPPLEPGANTACIFAVPEALINKGLEGFAQTPIEAIGAAPAQLTADIAKVCGNGIAVSKLSFTPNGTPKVVITNDKVSGSLTGTLDVFDSANASPFLTATASLTYSGGFTYEEGCIVINLVFDSMAEVKFVNGQTPCDASYQASQAFTTELKGKATIKECVEPSPFVKFPMGETTVTPGNGYVTCEHQKKQA